MISFIIQVKICSYGTPIEYQDIKKYLMSAELNTAASKENRNLPYFKILMITHFFFTYIVY